MKTFTCLANRIGATDQQLAHAFGMKPYVVKQWRGGEWTFLRATRLCMVTPADMEHAQRKIYGGLEITEVEGLIFCAEA